MKKFLLLISIGICFADNTNLFNQAYQSGQQNQFKLNLNQNSNFDSYGQANKFESSVTNGANTGNANSKTMYNNTYGDNADPNYLYKEGTKDIAACQSKSDPRCTTLNKYGDKGTQTQLQAYSQGISSKYYISVKPDPSDSSCSTVTRKVPVNQSTVTCTASAHSQDSCNSNISISLNHYDCDPTNGACNTYINNKNCTLVRPYVAPVCTSYKAYANHGNCAQGLAVLTCNVPSSFRTPGCSDSGGRVYQCGGCSTGGDPMDHNACWGQTCTNWTQATLATYQCKAATYSDGCAGFKR